MSTWTSVILGAVGGIILVILDKLLEPKIKNQWPRLILSTGIAASIAFIAAVCIRFLFV